MSVVTSRSAECIGERGARGEVDHAGDPSGMVELPLQVRLPDGRTVDREVAAWRHRRLHLALLHSATNGYVEIGQGHRAPGAKTWWGYRGETSSFVPGGGMRGHESQWLDRALDRVTAAVGGWRNEVAVGPAARGSFSREEASIVSTRWLWLGVDREALPGFDDLLRERPAHLRVEPAERGDQHAYWMLDRPLPAATIDRRTGMSRKWIELAHRRLIRRAGGSDSACAVAHQLMRLSGTVNYECGRHARIIHADLALPPYPARGLVGDLPDLN
jgi:hypothetical protein